MGHYIRTLNNIIECPQMPVDSTCSLLSYQAFHVSCQGHYVKSNPEKAVEWTEGPQLSDFLKPERVRK